MSRLRVAECFGPVWQGEGPATGHRASFLRLGLCNLACEWCDTPYTWDHSRYDVRAECPERDPEELLSELDAHGTDLLVLTGGEPLIWRNHADLKRVCTTWHERHPWLHVETNGTLGPSGWMLDAVDLWAVSPKVATDQSQDACLTPALDTFARLTLDGRAVFKFVCRNEEDVDRALTVAELWHVPLLAVWIMPEGTTADAVLSCAQAIAPAVEAGGAHLTLRQHVLLYGAERCR